MVIVQWQLFSEFINHLALEMVMKPKPTGGADCTTVIYYSKFQLVFLLCKRLLKLELKIQLVYSLACLVCLVCRNRTLKVLQWQSRRIQFSNWQITETSWKLRITIPGEGLSIAHFIEMYEMRAFHRSSLIAFRHQLPRY